MKIHSIFLTLCIITLGMLHTKSIQSMDNMAKTQDKLIEYLLHYTSVTQATIQKANNLITCWVQYMYAKNFNTNDTSHDAFRIMQEITNFRFYLCEIYQDRYKITGAKITDYITLDELFPIMIDEFDQATRNANKQQIIDIIDKIINKSANFNHDRATQQKIRSELDKVLIAEQKRLNNPHINNQNTLGWVKNHKMVTLLIGITGITAFAAAVTLAVQYIRQIKANKKAKAHKNPRS